MNLVSPRSVLQEVSVAVPPECRKNIIVVGSLAAGYLLFKDSASLSVRTKDIDCVLSPRIEAVKSGVAITEKLLAKGWKPRAEGRHSKPGNASTPDDDLPVVRLGPPNSKEWFIELLTVPESEHDAGKRWTRLQTTSGHYGLPSFRFMSINTFQPVKTEFDICCARPEMMALANLLEHPIIRPDLIEGTQIKRSNKDLGRVLAIAALIPPEGTEAWPAAWEEALRDCYPGGWQLLAAQLGDGIRELLQKENEFEQAYDTCVVGLLASLNVTTEQLRVAGQRLIQYAIEPLEKSSKHLLS